MDLKQGFLDENGTEKKDESSCANETLMRLMEKNDVEGVLFFIEKNSCSSKILEYIVKNNNIKAVMFFFANRGIFQLTKSCLDNCVFCAVSEGNMQILRILAENGGDMTLQKKKASLLSYACMKEFHDIFNFLIEKEAPLSSIDLSLSPVFITIEKRNCSMFAQLLLKGIDPNSFYIRQGGSFQYAINECIRHNFRIGFLLLLAFGANPKLIAEESFFGDNEQLLVKNINNENNNDVDSVPNEILLIRNQLKAVEDRIFNLISSINKTKDHNQSLLIVYLKSLRSVYESLSSLVPQLLDVFLQFDPKRRYVLENQNRVFCSIHNFQKENEQIDEFEKIINSSTNEWRSNKNQLIQMGKYHHLLMQVAGSVYDHVESLGNASKKYILYNLNLYEEKKKKIVSMEGSSPLLSRIGVDQDTINDIADLFPMKKSLIDESIAILNDNSSRFLQIGSMILKALQQISK